MRGVLAKTAATSGGKREWSITDAEVAGVVDLSLLACFSGVLPSLKCLYPPPDDEAIARVLGS